MVLRRVFYLALASMMAFMVSCKDKDEETQQPTPTPEPTPVVPTKEITLDFNWYTGVWNQEKISIDTVKKYADMEDVKFVFLTVVNDDNGLESSGFSTRAFHRAHDTLQSRFDISDKVRGSGIIYVDPMYGAQVPNDVNGSGMHVRDSAWFAEKGYQIKRYDPSAQKSR